MPEAIAEAVHAAPVVGLQQIAVFIDVRDVAEGLVAEPALLERGGPRLGVQLAVEALREGDLLVVGEGLVAKNQHGVLVHAGPDLGERLRIVHPPEIDRADLGGEVRMKLLEGQWHPAPSCRE